MDVLEDVAVIDFARSGLFAAWVVADLEIGDFIPAAVYVGNQVSFADLLMVKVVKNLAGGTSHSFANRVGLGHVLEEKPWVIHVV